MVGSATMMRDARGRVRLTPERPVKYNLSLTSAERDTLNRRAFEAGYSNAAEFVRREIIGGGEPRLVAPQSMA